MCGESFGQYGLDSEECVRFECAAKQSGGCVLSIWLSKLMLSNTSNLYYTSESKINIGIVAQG